MGSVTTTGTTERTKRLMKAMMGAAAAAACLAMGCGPGAIKDVVGQPDTPEIPGKAECKPGDITKKLSPLIIDWPSTLRGDLETVMAEQSVAVIKFSCDGVEVLTDCQVPGAYGYRGISPKEENTLIEGADDISANFGGVQFGANVDFSQSAKLDLATVTVGKRSTPRKVLTKGELGEYCEGATHFVRRADIGAFAMSTGSNVQAGAALQVFGQGVSGGSSSTENKSNKDGDPKSCKGADRKSEDAPSGCGALIRVTLMPIADEDVKVAKKAARKVEDDIGCPEGFVFAEDKCIKKAEVAKVKHFVCDEGNESQCTEQCKKGSNGSCDRLAAVFAAELEESEADFPDISKIAPMEKRFIEACEDDFGNACFMAAASVMIKAMKDMQEQVGDAESVEDIPAPLVQRMRDGLVYFEEACVAGHKKACDKLKEQYLKDGVEDDPFAKMLFGDKDLKKEYGKLLTRGCHGGSAGACKELFDLSVDGKLGDIAPADYVSAGENACIGGFAEACLTAALLLQPDEDTCKKTFAGLPAMAEACNPDVSMFPSSTDRAAYLIKRGCALNENIASSGLCQ